MYQLKTFWKKIMSYKNKENKEKVRYSVAIPFLTNSFNFKILRKSKWSIIDYFFLKRLSLQDYDLEEISEYSNFKPQLVIQILLPMIKLGWIDIVSTDSNFIFRITEAGKSACQGSKLPDIVKDYTSHRSVFVDLFGNYYGTHNLNFTPENSNRINELRKLEENNLIKVSVPITEIYPDYEKMFVAAARDHEEAVEMESFRYSINDTKYMLVDMLYKQGDHKAIIQDTSIIEGMDKRLKTLIEATLPSTVSRGRNKQVKNFTQDSSNREDHTFHIPLENVQEVYGGPETKDAFLDLIINSTDYLIIHSTFIGSWCILDAENDSYSHCFLEIKEALKRGVNIYILWGKDEPEEGDIDYESSKNEIDKIEGLLLGFQNDCISENIQNLVNYNGFNKTGSHAKFVVTNHAEKGHCFLIGSCNFLYTIFSRFEASVIVYNEQFVSYFLTVVADISTGKDFHTNHVRDEIRSISNLLRKKPLDKHSSDKLIKLRLVFKNDHYHYIDLAKKYANRRIYILSDRLNSVPERPIYDALKENTSTKHFYYSERSKHFSNSQEVATVARLKKHPYKMHLIEHKHKQATKGKLIRSHAKVLAWDNNHLLITSLNWLSSNASSNSNINETYHEIGIYIEGWDVGKRFINKFKEF